MPHTIYVPSLILSSSVYCIVKIVELCNIKYAIKIPRQSDGIVPDSILEISALMLVRGAHNVIQIHDLEYTLSPDILHPGIILTLYETSAKYHPPSQDTLKSAMFDICNGMLALYNRHIYHLDLKPDNILFNKSHYYISDLGSSLKVSSIYHNTYNLPVQSPCYRAPEVALAQVCSCTYNCCSAIDIWSIGIIMGEFAGKSAPRWIHPIIDFLSTTASACTDLNLLLIHYVLFGKTSIHPDIETHPIILDIDVPQVSEINIRDVFAFMTPCEYDFMMSMLTLNPKQRATYHTIFEHSYFTSYKASEPLILHEIDKVRTGPHLKFKALTFDNQAYITLQDRITTIDALLNCNWHSHNVLFLAIMLLDYYIINTAHIMTEKIQLIAGTCMMLASIIDDTHDPWTVHNVMKFAEPISCTASELEALVFDILTLCEHNLWYATEVDYVDAYLDDMKCSKTEFIRIRNSIFEQLIRASKYAMYRNWSLDTLISGIISNFMRHRSATLHMLQTLGIV